jgi:hypothetical protein
MSRNPTSMGRSADRNARRLGRGRRRGDRGLAATVKGVDSTPLDRRVKIGAWS